MTETHALLRAADMDGVQLAGLDMLVIEAVREAATEGTVLPSGHLYATLSQLIPDWSESHHSAMLARLKPHITEGPNHLLVPTKENP